MKLAQPWIPTERIQEIVTLEPVLVVLGLAAGAWIFYKLFLQEVSEERHRNLRRNFRNLLLHMAGGMLLFVIFQLINRMVMEQSATLMAERINSYIGFAALLWGTLIFVKTARILVFEYLFLSHMRVAVPLLLVNIFTLVLFLILAGWIATDLFNVRLTPLLATSAILSLVLGLALQDTLGNLFAGIALQFDKPYEIGDWIEIQNGSQKWVGMVHEISWRATVLVGFGDETITVANRIMAQSEIANFSARERPFYRAQSFKLPHDVPIERVKEIISLVALAAPGVRKEPLPMVLVSELNESWIVFKLIYTIDSYGQQYIIADRVFSTAVEALNRAGFKLASSRIIVSNDLTG